LLEPLHFAPASHGPRAPTARHVLSDPSSTLVGHALLCPVQKSAGSHAPLEARHCVVVERYLSRQVAVTPSHFAPASHIPCEPATRHVTVDGEMAFAGQVAEVLEQKAAASQGPVAARQGVVERGANASVGHAALVPEQTSATSQAPALARHTEPDRNLHWPSQQPLLDALGGSHSSFSAAFTVPSPQNPEEPASRKNSECVESLQFYTIDACIHTNQGDAGHTQHNSPPPHPGGLMSAGHVPDFPVQVSAGSHV